MQHELHSMEVILQKFQEMFNVLNTEVYMHALYLTNCAELFQLIFVILICQGKKDALSWDQDMEHTNW
jgi:hypothetical protein